MSALNTRRKGQRLERLARQLLESLGASVEPARPVLSWETGQPRTVAGDFYTVWDGLACWPDGRRSLYQVTVAACVSARRRKILASGFPVTSADLLLGYVGGRDRHWRVYRGPGFDVWERWAPLNESRSADKPRRPITQTS